MTAAITVQWIGIAAASAVVVVLLIVLVVRRSRGARAARADDAGDAPAPPILTVSSSFLDEPVGDGFASLGKLDRKGAAAQPDGIPATTPATNVEPAETASSAGEPRRGLTWDDSPLAAGEPRPPGDATPPPDPLAPRGPEPDAVRPTPDPEATPAAATEAAGETEAAASALSDVIVTTKQAQVDLSDPEVRRLLKSLIRDEIELAEHYRSQGQNLDAILQLTEAEKACVALGMTSQVKLIRAMMKELQP